MTTMSIYVIEMATARHPTNWQRTVEIAPTKKIAKVKCVEIQSRNPNDLFRVVQYYAMPRSELIKLRRRVPKAS